MFFDVVARVFRVVDELLLLLEAEVRRRAIGFDNTADSSSDNTYNCVDICFNFLRAVEENLIF